MRWWWGHLFTYIKSPKTPKLLVVFKAHFHVMFNLYAVTIFALGGEKSRKNINTHMIVELRY